MNNFNEVFLAIKRQCARQKSLAEISNLEGIARDANIPMDKLELYLSHLQECGLIRYSVTERYIHLTTFGQKQITLIKDKPNDA